MELKALRGELIVAGRWAASLSHVDMRINAGDVYSITGHIASSDPYWITSGGPFDLAVNVGARRWRWRHVDLALVGESFRAAGTGRPEIT